MPLQINSLRKQKVFNLLKGIETGDPESVKVVNEDKYIQHNPQTHEGGEGLAELFARLAKTNPKVEIVRLFEDGDYVFGHTIYDFASVSIGFEVFRYEGDYIVEHWDNIQPRIGEMVGGSVEATDFGLTESNRQTVSSFLNDVCINKDFDRFKDFVNPVNYTEHSTLLDFPEKIQSMEYKKTHRALAEGNFVLTINEGDKLGVQHSFYDLFRLENGLIVEHWDTTEKVPPKESWKNNNGKF